MASSRASVTKCLEVSGTRYLCFLRYISQQRLDPLALFFFRALKREQRIDVLVKSFGLNRRLVHNILGDLLRRRYASLDVKSGVIRPIVDEREVLTRTEDRSMVEVWQDHATGGLIMASVADLYTDVLDGAMPLTASTPGHVLGFLDMPDAALIALLRRAAPDAVYEDDGRWRLDRLVRRNRLRNETLYVPLHVVELPDGNVTHYVDAPEIPPWMCRSWTSHILYQTPQSTTAALAEQAIRTTDRRASWLDEARLGRATEDWLTAAREVVYRVPAPADRSEIQSWSQCQSALLARLHASSTVQVLLAPGDVAQTWARWCLRRAHHTLVFLMPDPSSTLVEQLVAEETLAEVVVVRGVPPTVATEGKHRVGVLELPTRDLSDTPAQPIPVFDVLHGRLELPCALIDGTVAVIASPTSDGPALIIEGAEPVRSLTGLVIASLQIDRVGSSQLTRRLQRTVATQALLVDEHKAAREGEEALGNLRKALTGFADALESVVFDDVLPEDSAGQHLPHLRDALADISDRLERGFGDPWAFPLFVEGGHHLTLLAEALTRAGCSGADYRAKIVIHARGEALWRWPSDLVELARRATSSGATIEVVWHGPPVELQILAASTMGQMPGVRLMQSEVSMPFTALVFDDALAWVGDVDWLQPERDDRRHWSWGIDRRIKSTVAEGVIWRRST